jgi:hypothetical protein
MKKYLFLWLIFLPSIIFAGEYEQAVSIIDDLKTNYNWVSSYKLGEFDCSVQSSTLWYVLNEKRIRCLIVSSIYLEEKNVWKDHIFLIASLDKKMYMVDATSLTIQKAVPMKKGYIVTKIYDNPEEANEEWPGEYIKWNINLLRKGN